MRYALAIAAALLLASDALAGCGVLSRLRSRVQQRTQSRAAPQVAPRAAVYGSGSCGAQSGYAAPGYTYTQPAPARAGVDYGSCEPAAAVPTSDRAPWSMGRVVFVP